MLEKELREVADGVVDRQGRFYPFKHYVYTVSATSFDLPPRSSRIYVKSCSIGVRLAAGDVTTSVHLYGYCQGYGNSLAKIQTLPSTAAVYNVDFDVRVLLDPGKPPGLVAGGGDPTVANIVMIYAEVPNDV